MKNGIIICNKVHLIDPIPAGIKKTVSLDQFTNAVKTNFRFKVFRVDQISLLCPPKVIKKASSL